MKVSPVAAQGMVAVNPNEGHSAGSDRLARAKAIAAGQEAPVPAAQSTETPAQEPGVKRIKMHVQRSTNRHEAVPVETPAPAPEQPVETAPAPTQGDTLAQVEQVTPVAQAPTAEDPQFVALARAKRALQAKEREIQAREEALKAAPAQTGVYTQDQIRANALSILREAGVTNEQLTEAILQEQQGYAPGFSKLETEIKALKDALETKNQAEIEREKATEKQVLNQVRADVDSLIAQGDEFEAVRAAGYAPKVVDLMYRVFKTEGKLLDTAEAAKLVEDALIEDSLKLAALKKVQSRVNPVPQVQPTPAAKPGAPNVKVMRTLTNRDGSSPTMSRRERAIAAMEGRLK